MQNHAYIVNLKGVIFFGEKEDVIVLLYDDLFSSFTLFCNSFLKLYLPGI